MAQHIPNDKKTADNFIEHLSPALFWDMDKSQLEVYRHAKGIIQRVLEYGTLADWRLTKDFYGLDFIVACCKQLRTLNPVALSFICAISDTDKKDYRCYHFRQSHPTLWNS